jgi:hypothetical protein
MRIENKEYKARQEDLDSIDEAQNTAVEMIRKHLAGPLQHVESMVYSRLEMASAYLMLAYHALRIDQPTYKAGYAFSVLSHFARQRIERDIKHSKRRKALFH